MKTEIEHYDNTLRLTPEDASDLELLTMIRFILVSGAWTGNASFAALLADQEELSERRA